MSSIRQMVLDVLKADPNMEYTADAVHQRLPVEDVSREQVSNSLSDLCNWSEIRRVRRGVYLFPEIDEVALDVANGVTESESTDETAGSVSDVIRPGERPEDKFFTQVGKARNGDLLITRDSDGAAYRATPL